MFDHAEKAQGAGRSLERRLARPAGG